MKASENKKRSYVYLPGGDPHGTFTAAAMEIMKRAMPYIGNYNKLYRRNSRPYQSVARGLSADLGVPVGTDNLFFGHGVKESMMMSARFVDAIARDVRDAIIAKTGRAVPIKFLVRAPTYKHVLSQFKGFNSFDVELVPGYDQTDSKNFGTFNHLNFLSELEDHNPVINDYAKLGYVVGYLDINPCNPSGYVRDKQETLEIGRLLGFARALNMRLLQSMNVRPRLNREHFVLVEDHIYRGLEHDGVKASSYCQMGPDVREVAHTVFGVAKYGLVGMRGSVTIAPAWDAAVMQDWFEEQNSDVSPFSVLSCEYMFGDNPSDIAVRDKYLRKQNTEYERNAMIAAAIINGKARDFLSPAEHSLATRWLTQHGNISGDEAHDLLDKGISGIETVALPRAGFFLLLNYDGLIDFADDEKYYESKDIIKFISHAAHYHMSMNIGDAPYMGLDGEFDTVMRFTVALSPADLVDRLLRLRDLSDMMKKVGPINSDNIPDPKYPFERGPVLRDTDRLAPPNCGAEKVHLG